MKIRRNKRKLSLAIALVGAPGAVLLDEPSSGAPLPPPLHTLHPGIVHSLQIICKACTELIVVITIVWVTWFWRILLVYSICLVME